MRLVLLLLLGVLSANATVVEIVSANASSGAGLSGTGSYARDVSVGFALHHYELPDMPSLPGLSQGTYLRYSYTFAAKTPFQQLILGLGADCALDPQCIFGIEITGGVAGAVRGHHNDPGLADDPLYGISFDGFPAATNSLQLSFFSNRLPGPGGRLFVQGAGGYFTSDPGAVTTPDFFALPQHSAEGEDPVGTPEPFSAGLAGGGLLAVGIYRRLLRS